jgi:glycyl-tRNA synthetase alpha chain
MKPVKNKSFQDIILNLTNFWVANDCTFLQAYDVEVGAGTLHPATALRALADENWSACYVQSSRRPTDGRYGLNPNRLQRYYQFQTIIKPSPDNLQELYLKSLEAIGVESAKHDIRFVEDDWENPSIGASGLGWEVWLDGMEVSQFTYMQQIGGIECKVIPGEITYGLERLAMYIQGKESVFDLDWDNKGTKYKDIALRAEQEFSAYNLEHANTDILFRQFSEAESEANYLLEKCLALPAYDQCLKASHLLNLLDARGVLGVNERALFIAKIRNLVKDCCKIYLNKTRE